MFQRRCLENHAIDLYRFNFHGGQIDGCCGALRFRQSVLSQQNLGLSIETRTVKDIISPFLRSRLVANRKIIWREGWCRQIPLTLSGHLKKKQPDLIRGLFETGKLQW